MLAKISLVLFLINVAYGQVQQDDVRFFFTSPDVRMQEFNTSDIKDLNMDNTKKVQIIAHGWLDGRDAFWYEATISNYLVRENSYIIALDWSKHALGSYTKAVENLPEMGPLIATMILEMADAHNISLNNYHLIGHSLGAHLFGYAGQYILATRGKKVGRITGLDPAGPTFEETEPDYRISTDDAVFVDIIHTDSGGLGYKGSIGHIDYYPNGGTARQKGCPILLINCSHNRAPILFHESIISRDFVAVRCNDITDFRTGKCDNNPKIFMGKNVKKEKLYGNYHLNTADSPPFALGAL